MTQYGDTFARSGPLAGSATETGGGTWNTAGTAVTTGNRASLQSGAAAWLTVGVGDVDLSVDVTSGGTASAYIRGVGGAGGWRLEGYSQSYSSGYYQTQTNYSAQYRVGASVVDSRDQSSCPPLGSNVYRSQCGSSSFPQSFDASCGSYGSNYTAYLQYVTAQGTCQVYVPGSYTVYFTRLTNPAGQQVWSGQSSFGPTLRLRGLGSSVTAWVDGQQVWTGTDADSASRARNSHGLYSASGQSQFTSFTLDTLNVSPNAPQLRAPASNDVVDITQPIRLEWIFNDPDVGDTQSAADIRYRPVGTATWTTATATTATSTTLPIGAVANGAQIEWQVRTYDSQGLVGPWSAQTFFRGGTPPPGPTWLAPVPGGTIPTQQYAAQWSAPAQDSYELTISAVTAGTVASPPLLATGEVPSSTREAALSFPDNGTVRELAVRVKAGGLWSAWSRARATVSYTPPATPSVYVTPDQDGARILVDLRNPTPTGTQPPVQFHDLYRQVGTAGEERVATQVPVGGRWIDWTPASGVEHRYRALAYGVNGVTSTSDPTA